MEDAIFDRVRFEDLDESGLLPKKNEGNGVAQLCITMNANGQRTGCKEEIGTEETGRFFKEKIENL